MLQVNTFKITKLSGSPPSLEIGEKAERFRKRLARISIENLEGSVIFLTRNMVKYISPSCVEH